MNSVENIKHPTIENVFQSKLNDYRSLLDTYRFHYIEQDLFIEVGKCSPENKGQLFISVLKSQAIELFSLIFPVLLNKGTPFKIVKDPLIHHYINIGRYGQEQLGKVLTLYPNSEDETISLIKLLSPLISRFQGPEINDTIKIGSSFFGSFSETVFQKSCSVNWNKVKANKKVKRIGRYFLTKKIKLSPKGNIYKAISLKEFSFTPCIIKEGRLNMVDDYYGRTIRDRLLWQMKVLSELYNKIRVPKILDFFEVNGNSYLVMEAIKGISLESKIAAIYQKQKWNELSVFTKLGILTYYIKSLQTIDKIHQSGFVHRDIKHDNFMILPTGEPLILDFELSYSYANAEPTYPFNTINPAYQSPEQLNNIQPMIQEDIYACGCLLVYLLTGFPPVKLMKNKSYGIVQKLEGLKINKVLINLISSSLHSEALSRPQISQIIAGVKDYIHSSITESPENYISFSLKSLYES